MTKVRGYIFAAILSVIAIACNDDVTKASDEPQSSGSSGIIEIITDSTSSEKSSSSYTRPAKTNIHFSNKVEIKSFSSQAKSSSSKAKDSSSSSKQVTQSSSSEIKSSSSAVPQSSSKQQSSSSEPQSSATLNFYDCNEYNCVTTENLNPDISYGEFLDKRDNQVYRTIVISNHVWTAQNLNYKINHNENDTESDWCYENEPENCEKFGRLYTWNIAMEVCPEGWHLPTAEEWEELFIDHTCEIEKKESNPPKYHCVGTFLKAVDGWENATPNTNEYGFSVVAAGYKSTTIFMNKGISGYLWTATSPYEMYAKFVSFNHNEDYSEFIMMPKNSGLPVRCVKGNVE